MTPAAPRLPAILMAGGRASEAFVAETGLPHRSLLRVPHPDTRDMGTATMLEIAALALRRSKYVSQVYTVTDLDAPDGTQHISDHGGFVENLFAGIAACVNSERACVCTADMPFLTAASVDGFLEAAHAVEADLVYPIIKAEACERAYPGLRRTSLPTREGRFTGGNIVLIRPAALLSARSYIEAAHAKRKSPLQLAMMLGLGATLGVALSLATRRGLVSVAGLETAVSRLIHARARAVVSDDPALGTDIDRPEDAAAITAQRNTPS